MFASYFLCYNMIIYWFTFLLMHALKEIMQNKYFLLNIYFISKLNKMSEIVLEIDYLKVKYK